MNNELGFFVTEVATCPECNGDGAVYDPIWASISDELDTIIRHRDIDPHTRDQIYRDTIYAAFDGSEPGPEEHTCPECAGDGVITRHTPLVAALRTLGISQEILSTEVQR